MWGKKQERFSWSFRAIFRQHCFFTIPTHSFLRILQLPYVGQTIFLQVLRLPSQHAVHRQINQLFPVVPLLRIKGVVTLWPCTRTLRRPAFKPHYSLLFVMSETQNPEMQRPKTPVTVGETSSRQEHALAATVFSKWLLTLVFLLSL